MSLIQIRVLFGLLALVHVGLAVLLTPIHLAVGSDIIRQRIYMAAIGALMSQPALIAVWAGLAPQTALRRWTQALAMLMCVEFAFNLASAQNASSRGQPGDLLQPLAWLLAFAICTLPLAFLRARYGWRVEPPPAAARQSEGEGNQFTMRGLLAATAAAAVYLAGLRWLHPDGGPRDWPLHVARFAAMGASMSLPGLLVLIVCFLCLLPGPGGVRRWLLGIAGFGSTAIAAAAVAWFGSPGEIGELAFVLVGLFMSSAGSAIVARLCGYRLARQSAGAATATQTTPASPGTSHAWRFAAALSVQLLLLLCLAAMAPSRLRTWRETAVMRDWSELGMYASLNEDAVVSLTWNDDGKLLKGTRALERIAGCSELERLDLGGSETGDEALAQLGPLEQLTSLTLCGTRVSDEGLQALDKFRSLQQLDLNMTDVTDDGLPALAKLDRLTSVDLSHTLVTPGGVKRLQRARPALRIQADSDDASLSPIANCFRRTHTRISQNPAPHPPALRVRATGVKVTDKGVAYFRGLTQIAEFDLTDAKVTDVSINNLATLKGLRRLTLRGTQITDAGAAELKQALPKCEINR